MLDVAVIDNSAAAESSLDPLRSQLLRALREPGSATTLAATTGLPRQKVNYHLRSLERHGLLQLVEERQKGNCIERVLQATARSYVISPAALPEVEPDPTHAPDRLSARWLLSVGARLVRDVGDLLARADKAGQPVATFALDADIRFATASDRAAFANEFSTALTELVARYHAPAATSGRTHRVVFALHPTVTRTAPPEEEVT